MFHTEKTSSLALLSPAVNPPSGYATGLMYT